MTASEEIHVWRCQCPASDDAISEFTLTLSDDERGRALRARSHADRARFITTRGVLRRILSGYVDAPPAMLRFQTGILGKPRLDRCAFRATPFSLSRAGDRMIVAVAPGMKGDIGADLVELHPDDANQPVPCRELLANYFPQFTRPDITDRECERVFARLWSQSEAILKARGSGFSAIMLPLEFCNLGENINQWRAISDGMAPGRMIYELMPIDGYAAALVAPGPLRDVRVRIYNADFERPLKLAPKKPESAAIELK
jgi:phosphopantetheinyl transferase